MASATATTASPPPPPPREQPNRPTLVLSLGMPRTGTASMAEALRILGYQDVWHGVDAVDTPSDWHILNRAVDSTFPNLPSYNGRPFRRKDWDEIWGHCEAITDIGSIFGPQLVETYPEAKVILVERDIEKWYDSIDKGVFSTLWGPLPEFFVSYVEPVLGSMAGPASRKTLLGFFEAENVEEIRAKARDGYKAHYRRLRNMVPRDKLLDFTLDQGWGPLCEFLGKEVPENVPFPHVNDADALKAKILEVQKRHLRQLGGKLGPWLAAASVALVGLYMAKRNGLL